jgi:hypothetical protein
VSKRALHPGIVIVLAVFLADALAGLGAAQINSETVRVGTADLGGVVSSPKGPEARVWVIAEIADLPTKLMCGFTATSWWIHLRRQDTKAAWHL